ncbi:FkbM family methyltransferase [Rhizobium cauense]|uniref:FkbM family methyltransferase n=1 Tax=Rhizobium cauense TaxID=1166683 RepID=UPI001C6E5E08|nr:FkbM family methyltransferase [Rhizobium cauense]MBW9118298.1 FkbM family methyltransferase [Rhizobium cauense]
MSSRHENTPSFSPPIDEMRAIIRGLYLGLLAREPDAGGLANWIAIWQGGANLGVIAEALILSEEYKSKRPSATSQISGESAAIEALPGMLRSSPVVIVDVGAQILSSEDHVYAGLIDQKVPTRVIGFEPLEHRRVERLESEGPGLTLLPAFVGDGKEHVFHTNEPDSTSSLLPFNQVVTSRLLELAPLRTVATEPVMTSTLDEALKEEAYVDLLKLDIQGFELEALRHANEILRRTLVVHCEVSFVEIYKGQALFSEIEQYMRTKGFELVDFPTLCHYPIANTPYNESRDWLGWGDAVFFRRLEDNANWREALVQSLIAFVVYGKSSLASSLAQGLENTPAAGFMDYLLKGAK